MNDQGEREPFYRQRRFYLFCLLACILVVCDLLTKQWASRSLIRPYAEETEIRKDERLVALRPDGGLYLVRKVEVIPPFWSFTYVRNLDIGFSILSFLDDYISPSSKAVLLKILQLSALLLILGYFLFQQFQYFPAFTLIIGGGLGNIIDRFSRGYVVDFVRWEWPGSPFSIFKPWPIFNAADTFVSIGAIVLISYLLRETFQRKRHVDG